MTSFYTALTLIGGLLLLLGVTSGLIKRDLYLSEPLVALLLGVLIGPGVLGFIQVANWGDETVVLQEAARFTLAISLMGVALRLPRRYIFENWRPLGVLLGAIMPLMWLVSSLLVYLILPLPPLVALLVGAALTPTDPVVASSIVSGRLAEKNIPARLRNVLSAESGANDGLALPFVMLPLLLLEATPRDAFTEWLGRTVLWEVGVATLLGALLGFLATRLLHWSWTRQVGEKVPLLAVVLSLSLTVLGVSRLLESDAVLAVFVSGVAFNRTYRGEGEGLEHFAGVQEIVTRFFELPVFVLFGAALPWAAWLTLGWRGLLLAAAVLLLRRLPGFLLLGRFIGPLHTARDVRLLGWFGPIGISALFYGALSLNQGAAEAVWTVVSLVTFVSVLAFGVTATPLTRAYGQSTR